MKRLSLQWRLTLMTAALTAVACLLLNVFISYSAIMQIDEIENYAIELAPVTADGTAIDVDKIGFSWDFPTIIEQAKETFRVQSLVATIGVILLAGSATYVLAGRALKPLRQFSDHMETIQAQNLSDPLPETEAEDEIARLTRSFNEMVKRLDQAFQTQGQFVSHAAHELRTPLAVMQTNLEVLQKREHPTSANYDELVEHLSQQIERLSQLVSVLLEMAELQTVKRADRISLAELTEEVVCDLMQIADDKEVSLVQEAGEAIVMGSDVLLYRAIYNLIENAIKYNRRSGSVHITIHAERKTASITVSDTGYGIDPDEWVMIFEPFHRADTSYQQDGFGLGLTLVKRIAEIHGGTVEIVSSSPSGTEMRFTIPA